jgi:tripartite-type tricarboxylate transporter receptor subunit TctC
MTHAVHKFFARAAVLSMAGIGATDALAQPSATLGWPTKPVRIVVPFAPGGSSDTIARSLAQRYGEIYKQTFIVENRPGAGGTVASAQVAKSPPDGYQLVISSLASQVIAPVVQKGVQYESLKDWTHIALLGGPPTLLMVHPAHEARDFKGFVEWARKRGGGVPYATPGNGTHAHLLTEVLERQTKIAMIHVPYKGSGPAIADLLAGHIQTATLALAGTATHIRAGKLRPLATTSEKRLPELPDVPTFGELGFRDMTAITWFGLSGPEPL